MDLHYFPKDAPLLGAHKLELWVLVNMNNVVHDHISQHIINLHMDLCRQHGKLLSTINNLQCVSLIYHLFLWYRFSSIKSTIVTKAKAHRLKLKHRAHPTLKSSGENTTWN